MNDQILSADMSLFIQIRHAYYVKQGCRARNSFSGKIWIRITVKNKNMKPLLICLPVNSSFSSYYSHTCHSNEPVRSHTLVAASYAAAD